MASFTASQQAGIEARGNTLVMAGAGTGKTRTLVERCAQALLREPPRVELDALLVVTFTEAAAREMRERLRSRLEQAHAARPEDAWLGEQIALVDTAAIGTLHGFCGQLVREHFHELGLDPQPAILDEAQSAVLSRGVITDLFERRFADRSPTGEAFRNMVATIGQGRVETVEELLRALYGFARSLPAPEAWIERLRAFWSATSPETGAPPPGDGALEPGFPTWSRIAVEGLDRWAAFWGEVVAGAQAGEPRLAAVAAALAGFGSRASRDQQVALLADILEVKNAWPRKEARSRKPFDDLFVQAGEFHGSLAPDATGDPLAQDWRLVQPHMLALIDLTRAFLNDFAGARREAGALDFDDLEHFALRLLQAPPTGEPTRLGEEIRARYEMVLVDEYQDINAVQDRILRLVSRTDGPGNRFLVGDLKQSIYQFRRTDPTIFRHYADEWADGAAAGRTFHLQENFRSHPGLLHFVNDLFAALMRREVGGVEFGSESRLNPGDPARSWPVAPGPVEVLLCVEGGGTASEGGDPGDASTAGDSSRVEAEATAVARRLRELRETGLEVPLRDGGRRPVTWADMVILLRSPAARAESYAKVFEQEGVPLAVARRGLYESLEVQDLLNLLALLDNPLQDLPALAVFRSPLVGLTVDELAALRVHQRHGLVWTAAQRFHAGPHPTLAAEANPEGTALDDAEDEVTLAAVHRSAREKLGRFFDRYREWREWVRRAALSECLEAILTQTHYEDWLNLQPRRRQRRANVRQLIALARQFDQFQRHSLHRFLRFIDAQRESEFDPEPPAVEGADAVQLMSIHKSKGLEFPVVVVADLGKQFNEADLRGAILIDEKYGLCPRIQPPGARSSYPSLPLLLASERRRAELLGEELRLLYVACTRAEAKLILAGSATDSPRRPLVERWDAAPSGRWPTRRLLQARSVLDWLGPQLNLWGAGPDWLEHASGQNERFSWRIERPRPREAAAPEPPPTPDLPDLAELAAHHRRLDLPYPHPDATREPAKSSVTSLRVRTVAIADGDESRPLFREPTPAPTIFPPLRLEPDGTLLSAAERGTAHHRFLQYADLGGLATEAATRAQAEALAAAGRLPREEVDSLDFAALTAFGQSELAARLRGNAAAVRREFEFTLRLTPEDATRLGLPVRPGLAPDEVIVVQGVVDVAVIEPEDIWLVDFKTDRVTAASLEAKLRAYTPQLALYAMALGRIHRRPVREAWLYFLATGQAASVPLPGFLQPDEQPA